MFGFFEGPKIEMKVVEAVPLVGYQEILLQVNYLDPSSI